MHTNKLSILAQQLKGGGHSLRLRVLASVSAVSLFGMVAAVATVPELPVPVGTTVVAPVALDALGDALPLDQKFIREERFQQGDTLATLLSRLGVDGDETAKLVREHGNTKPFRALRPGMSVLAHTTGDGGLVTLRFLAGKETLVGFEREGDRFLAVEQDAALERQVLARTGMIQSSLFAAADDAGLPDGVATQLAEIFGGDVDFHRDLRRGDRFTVVYELFYHEGRPVRSGRVLAAEFVNARKAHRAVWFGAGNQEGHYYAPDGRSLKKAFLRSPLEFSRVTSGVSMRFHPILQAWRAHNGVDYAAPAGTKVRATSDGLVDFAGVQNGYGKVVVLRHGNGVTTHYAHLSGLAVQRGARVNQGETIGFVGATGWATGPHLHYEFRVNDQFRNPLATVLPEAEPIPPQQLAVFRAETGPLAARLDLARDFNLASLE